MNEEYRIVLPKLGESIVSATVVRWFKQEGDFVSLDEPLLEVSTDKVNSEIPSPVAGVLKKITVHPEQEVQVGELLAIVEKQGSGASRASSELRIEPEVEQALMDNRDFFSPSVLRLAAQNGISLEDLQRISGTGSGGRVTKSDLESYRSASKPKAPCPLAKSTDTEERMKMTGMRKAIADNMVKSFYEAPHATLIHEIDVTAIVKRIQREKEAFFAENGAKLTITAFILKALANALAEFPLLNSTLEQDTIVIKKQIHIGIAVSIEQGLIVPVVKNCHTRSLSQIAVEIQDLSEKARQGRLSPADVNEGTITVTNFGMSGVSIGVPIIRYPEVAIVGIGAIKKKVQVVEEDQLAIRSMLHLSLTFDHRVIDGMYGCSFLSSLQKHLEQ